MRLNLLAGCIVIALLVCLPAGAFAYQTWRTQAAGAPVIEITARTPQEGGFTPDHLELRAGERVRLRLSSPDVVHGFSVPGLGIDVAEILPGRPVEVDVTPAKPGRYAFACTRWCGADHWRMRGTLEVVDRPGAGVAARPTVEPPLFQRLGINLDAPRQPASPVPSDSGNAHPAAARGAALGVTLPAALADPGQRRAVSPAAAFAELRSDLSAGPRTGGRLTDAQVWDVVAWAWLKDASSDSLALGQKLYSRDCAACHGPTGRGDGPAGRNLPGLAGHGSGTALSTQGAEVATSMAGHAAASATGQGHDMADPLAPAGPANFTDPVARLAVSDAFLQGKLLRGGMGTGMPEFGSLYTPDEMWALVGYLRLFIFQLYAGDQ
jgi:mono/diheme cytochrome c family protein